MNVEEELTKFMKERQIKLGHPLNIFEFLEAKCIFTQSVSKLDTITEEQFKINKQIARLCFTSIIEDLKIFGITEKEGYLIDYLKD